MYGAAAYCFSLYATYRTWTKNQSRSLLSRPMFTFDAAHTNSFPSVCSCSVWKSLHTNRKIAAKSRKNKQMSNKQKLINANVQTNATFAEDLFIFFGRHYSRHLFYGFECDLSCFVTRAAIYFVDAFGAWLISTMRIVGMMMIYQR